MNKLTSIDFNKLDTILRWPIVFIKQYFNAMQRAMNTYFSSDMDVMSPEAKKIFANPIDREEYIRAVEELNKGESKEKTIKLQSGEEIVLIA